GLSEEQKEYINNCLAQNTIDLINEAFENFFTEEENLLLLENNEYVAKSPKEIEDIYLPRLKQKAIADIEKLATDNPAKLAGKTLENILGND
ncbi:394_t:CDS:1, partial [Funneliformis geosporum]